MSSHVEVAESIVRRIEGRVEEYVVEAGTVDSVMVKLANGEVSVVQSWRDYHVTLYVAKKGKISLSEYTAGDPREAIDRSISLVDKLAPSPLYAPLPSPSGASYRVVDGGVKDIALTGDAGAVIGSLRLEEAGNSAGMISVEYSRFVLLGSNGSEYESELTEFNGYLRVFRDGDSGQWSWVSTRLDYSTANRAIEKAVDLAETCSKLPKERVEPGRYRVALSPMVAGNLLQRVAWASSAGAVIMGFSFLQGAKPGDQVASEALTLRDAPRREDLPEYSTFDDEGVATRDKPLIEKGVFKGFIHNSKTARLMGAETTGNAGLIMPRLFNLEVDPGELRGEEVLEQLGTGIYATNNWYTRFQNYLTGQFSTVTRDALMVVRGGKPVACSRRVRIADTMPNLIKNIESLGSETWPIKWWEVDTPFLLPHMVIKEAGITAVTLESGGTSL